MFAEELGGNANKRRQEEARTRRRKLKQQQEQKKKLEQQRAEKAQLLSQQPQQQQQQQHQTNIEGAIETKTNPSTASLHIASTNSGDASGKSIVQKALQQREVRQVHQNQVRAALKIQAFYRAHQSNRKLLELHAGLLQKRLEDLRMVATLLQKQKKPGSSFVYIPPPATSTTLASQLIFITQSFPSAVSKTVQLRGHASKVKEVLELALLPGLNSSDENENPFLAWLQHSVGHRRIKMLIRIALVTATSTNKIHTPKTCVPGATMPNTNHTGQNDHNAAISTALEFIRALSGGSPSVPLQIVSFTKKILWQSSPVSAITLQPPESTKSLGTLLLPIQKFDHNLDLISLLRYNLLFNTGGPDPIPKTADHTRRQCIPVEARKQSDQLFRLVLQAIFLIEDTMFQHRFVSEILVIPLFPWKICGESIHALLLQPMSPLSKKIPLICILEAFISRYADNINAGQINQVLCSNLSLRTCPTTSSQALLANLMQIARMSPLLNGSQRDELDFPSSTKFYQIIATLVDAVPLATFSSRESVVEWISDGKGHHSPVVLSSVVMEQCRYLLSDSFVKKLFNCAIDDQELKTEFILNQKNDKDKKQETLLKEAGINAASMAAKEARVDRTKGFWKSSAWARRIKGGVSKMLTSPASDKTDSKGQKLIDASSLSRQLANGEVQSVLPAANKSLQTVYSSSLFKTLCKLYGIVLARWGGDGGKNRIQNSQPLHRVDATGAKQEMATSSADACTHTLLNTFIFSTNIIKASWGMIQSDPNVIADVYCLIDPNKRRLPVYAHSILPQFEVSIPGKHQSGQSDGAAILFLFTTALSRMLIVTDDSEIHELDKPIPLHQLRRSIQTLKQLLYRACCIDTKLVSIDGAIYLEKEPNYFGFALINSSARTMKDLYDRSSRRPLAIPKLWLIDDLLEKEIRQAKNKDDYVQLLSTPVLRLCPFLVSFKRRLKLFERIVSTDRAIIQGENSQNPFHSNPLKPGIPIRITRGRILEDGLATMNNLGRNMRQRLAVQYFNEAGTRESGIDAGGLFKEFWTDLCAIAFDPNYALFRVTEENCMYPNPSSGAAHGSAHITLFEFLGRILGKALYEGITVGPQFAHFFLSHLRGDYKYLNMLSDLSTMDAQLYNNIMFLKTYEGDATDLCLSFTVTVDDFGGNHEIPLMPNGSTTEVSNQNKQRYIQLVAKYYVVDRIKEQAEAFTRGLREVIDRSWLEIFNEPELQVLISGASEGKLDVDDMRANCRYAGGFTGLDRTTKRFWSVVASMDSKQQADLLRFVTSCERPPPLGFASLNPPLTLQRIGILRDGDKLPASSTCFNILKLPTYSSEKVMKERLIYAIESGAGFELT